MATRFKEFVFVPHCIICNRAVTSNNLNINLCPDCLGDLYFINSPYCPDCHGPIKDKTKHNCRYSKSLHYSFDYAISVLEYKDAIKTSHHNYKFHARPSYGKTLASLIHTKIMTLPFKVDADVIIAVPLGKKRLKKRGYNQAGIIAKNLASYLGIEYNDTALIRIRETEPQHTLSLYQRRLNVIGSFAVKDRQAISGKRVILVDDVFSSGNTIGEACNTLIKNGASSVVVVTLAATPHENKKDVFDEHFEKTDGYETKETEIEFTPSSKVCPSPLFELRKNRQ